MTQRNTETDDRIEKAAQFFKEEIQSKNPFRSPPGDIAPRSLEDAYAVQERCVELLTGPQDRIVGYKAAVTTTEFQQLLKLSEPIYGTLLSRGFHRSPASLSAPDYLGLYVEGEIAVELKEDLSVTEAPFTRDSVEGAVSNVMPAFELCDGRCAGLSDVIEQYLSDAFSVIGANVACAGVVLGEPVQHWQDIDLAEVRGVFSVNGKVAGEGIGRDLMGHPFEVVAWLANALARRGKSLTAGMVILTGVVVTPSFSKPGDVVTWTLDQLGEVSLSVAQ